jgi:hypothetical protein
MVSWPPVAVADFMPKDVCRIITNGLVKAVGNKVNITLIDQALRAAKNISACIVTVRNQHRRRIYSHNNEFAPIGMIVFLRGQDRILALSMSSGPLLPNGFRLDSLLPVYKGLLRRKSAFE